MHVDKTLSFADATAKIKELRRQINYHNHRYYVLDDPEIADQDYDILMYWHCVFYVVLDRQKDFFTNVYSKLNSSTISNNLYCFSRNERFNNYLTTLFSAA